MSQETTAIPGSGVGCGCPDGQESGDAEATSCCGPQTAEMMQGCSCGSFLKAHRLAALAIFSLVALAFLISQVGGILGIIAFCRTL